MDDERIEEMLRESWRPEPSPGMRERVLRRAGEAAPPARRRRRAGRWQYALACLGILSVALAGASDAARRGRIAAVQGDGGRPVVGVTPERLLEQRREMERLLARATGRDTDEEGSL
ncbi:MAG: hypothetical protein HY321_17370 [Armatimonadetes bacterium]|nr:hypothetical protein [Armatimonadota bacterium]